jgi:hypothetical protein
MVAAAVDVVATKGTNMKKKSNDLAKLSLAALALTGVMQEANAGRVDESYNGDFQYGHYSESGNRMSVDIFDLGVSAPIGKSMTFAASAVRDVISGASPLTNKKNAQGQIYQVLSGASQNAKISPCGRSICEQRDGVNSNLTYFFDNVALNLGGSVAFDVSEPTNTNRDCSTDATNANCHKTSQQYLLGVTQIIDKNSLVQLNMTYGYSEGYLSDPYKTVWFYNGNTLSDIQNDKRPRQKNQFAWLAQYVHNFDYLNNAALHADYRFGLDDWGINSHTTELSWHQPIGEGFQIIPRFRYYSQDSADFYAPVFSGTHNDYSAYSSDYRLAGFGAISGGLKIAKTFSQPHKAVEQLKLQAGVEYYDHSASYQLGGNNSGNFADFSYYLVNASINLKF